MFEITLAVSGEQKSWATCTEDAIEGQAATIQWPQSSELKVREKDGIGMGIFSKKKPTETNSPVVEATDHELDTIFANAQSGVPGALAELWSNVLRRPQLFMVARGQMPDVSPFVGVIDGRPMLAVFTSPSRSIEFAKKQGLFVEQDAFANIAQPPRAIVQTACRLFRSGVECVVIDSQVGGGCFAPISNLIGMYEHATGELLPIVAPAGQGEFDHRSGLLNASADSEKPARARQLVRRLMLIPKWFVPCAPGGVTPLVASVNGHSVLLAFSDQWASAAGLPQIRQFLPAEIEVQPIDLPAIIDFLKRQREANPTLQQVFINPATTSLEMNISALLNVWELDVTLRQAHGVS